MGIHDRDWYHDRTRSRRSPNAGFLFEERRKSGAGVLRALLCAAVLLAFGAVAHSWWQSSGLSKKLNEPRVVLRNGQPGTLPNLPPAEAQTPPEEITATTIRTYKCIVNGRVIYEGASDCRSSMPTAAVRLDPTPPEVPAGLTPYERELLKSADARIARQQAQELAIRQARPTPISNARAECALLDQQIRELDARARMPLPGYEQDAIRDARSRARSRQADIRC